MGEVSDGFLSKKVLFLPDFGQSTLVVQDQLLGKRGGEWRWECVGWERRVEVGVCGMGGEWKWEGVGWERRRVEVGVCGVGEEESGGGRVWGGRGGE